MKIIVSHPDRQHVDQLLCCLRETGRLECFYTLFAETNLLRKLTCWWPAGKSQLAKRRFYGVSPDRIRQYPILKALQYLLRLDPYFQVYPIFDRMVAYGLQNREFDLLISYENANLYSQQVARKQGKITVLDLAAVHHCHQYDLFEQYEEYRRLFPSFAYFDNMNRRKATALAYTDYVFCLSQYACQTLIEAGFPSDRIFIHPLGINHDIFYPKKQYRTPDGTLRLVFVGRMSRLKGLQLLFDALASFDPGQVSCTLIGPADDFSPDQFPPHVQYIPYLAHLALADALRDADVMVNPSYTDSWAQTVLEAMATGTPVIVTENTGAAEATHGGGGFVIPVNNAAALREKLHYFLNHPEALAVMGKQAHLNAKPYTKERYCQSVNRSLDVIAKNAGLAHPFPHA
ncbi:MAG: glycosyltransferase family 4 protein [Saprospiraceae bacterium]|nr:glycosyltransferase family 4 protein [Saprospiraceae bacterium]